MLMSTPRKIGVFTSARSEYGSFRALIKRIIDHPDLDLCLLVSGNHLVKEDGLTVQEIEADGFPIAARIPMFDHDRSREGFSKALGRELIGVTEALASQRPDLLLINGDRAELLPLVTAATSLGIPVAHIAGGEITEGAIDDSVRHAVTKLSHLHFPTNELHAQRIRCMGEEPWRITVSGEPALDTIATMPLANKNELESFLDIELADPVVLVTYHPETLGEAGEDSVAKLIDAMAQVNATYVVTYPNADPGSAGILRQLQAFVDEHPQAVLVPSLGQVRYYSMLHMASAMLGNSSSGLWEAPSFALPTVNVGGRQDGRLRAKNVIDVLDDDAQHIQEALRQALSAEFRDNLKGMVNPYGDGTAIDQIVAVLRKTPLGPKLLRKKFVDVEV